MIAGLLMLSGIDGLLMAIPPKPPVERRRRKRLPACIAKALRDRQP